MNFKLNLIVAFVASFIITITAASDLYQHETNMGLLNFMARSNNLLQQNPARSMECFTYYMPLINELAQKYESDYEGCLNTAAADHDQADADTLEQRTDLTNRAESSCALLNKCKESGTAAEEFECHMKGSSSNIKTMYDINSDASDELADLIEQYRLIDFKENKCTNETKREYEKNSNDAYTELNNCMMGISEVPTTAPETEPTDAPTTVEPETDAPTNAPTTVEPETDAPTDAPTTVEPETDAPTDAPTTVEPETDAPTDAPTSVEPETAAPTDAPTSVEPETDAPTNAPTTVEPETDAPTNAPTTVESETEAPTIPPSAAPEDPEASTEEGSNENTEETNSTEENNSTEEAADEKLPEEDLSRMLAMRKFKNRN